MNHALRLLHLLSPLLLLGAALNARAADVYVIAHPDSKLVAEAVRDVFLGDKQFAGDVKLVPLDNAAVQTDFLSKVLRLDAARYTNHWVKKSFRDALNPPAVKSSDKEVIDLVRKTPGAIAYVGSTPPPGVTVLQKF